IFGITEMIEFDIDNTNETIDTSSLISLKEILNSDLFRTKAIKVDINNLQATNEV
ncbi:13655_t:CDS:1, partial [Dentiscutata heterogama]